MRITKLVHSCILVESSNKKILVDPGVYSWADGKVKSTDFSGIDSVVITHAHPDHLNEDFADRVNKTSPNSKWYGPKDVVGQLSDWGITARDSSKDEFIEFIKSDHADLAPWFGQQPDHTSFLLFGELLITGDCQTLTSSHGAKYVAAAINGGPWGSIVGFSKMIAAMDERPQVVLPLHDWHWNDAARDAMYSRLPDVLGQFNVDFTPLYNGVQKEL